MEAETLQSRARVSQLQAELRQISSIRRGLEDQLLLSARNSCVCSLSSSTSPRRPPKVDSPRASSQVKQRIILGVSHALSEKFDKKARISRREWAKISCSDKF